jgi:Zn-dependent M16 (insulinase) family peptidase
MLVKSVITISEKEQECFDTVYVLLDDIERNEIARALIQEVLDDYELSVGDIKDLLFDIDSNLIVEK